MSRRHHFMPVTYTTTPSILTGSLPNGTQGTPYNQQLVAAGGTPPYLWSESGALDTGLSLAALTGIISGTPLNVETDTLTFTVTDANNKQAVRTLSLTIQQSGSPPVPTPVLTITGVTSNSITASVAFLEPPFLTTINLFFANSILGPWVETQASDLSNPAVFSITNLVPATNYFLYASTTTSATASPPNTNSGNTAIIQVTTPALSTAWNPPFPRPASYRIGAQSDNQSYGTAFQNWARKQALPIISAWYAPGNGGFQAISGHTKQSVLNALRTSDPWAPYGGKKIGTYGIFDANPGGNSVFGAYCAAQGWMLWVNGTSGTPVKNFYNSSWQQTNSTVYVPSDVNGRKVEDYAAYYQYNTFMTGSGGDAANFDLAFHDNMFKVCRENGDFNRDGTTDTASAYALAWRQGEARWCSQMLAFNPNLFLLGNLDGPSANPFDPNEYSGLTGNINGGLMEGAFGIYYSPLVQNPNATGWNNWLNEYRFRLSIAKANTLASATPIVILLAQNLTSTGSLATTASGTTPTGFTPNWKGARFAACATAMDQGFIAWSNTSYYDDADLYDFDWFGTNATQYPPGFAGAMVSSPPTAAFSGKGIWRNDYTNCIFLVAPPGNAGASIGQTDLGGGNWYRMRGTQDPTFDNATQVTDANPVVFAAGGYDGAILFRTPQ